MAFIHSQHQLTLTFGLLGNVISFLVYLAPVPTFYRIYRKKSTEGFHSLPYLVALFSSMLWLYYALLKKNAELLITINSFGCVVEMIYIAMYIAYAPNVPRKFTVKVFVSMNMGLFSLIALTSHFLVNGSHRVKVLGWICVAISVSVFAAPLSIVVIRTRSVEFMPFTLSFFLTLSAIMWFGYGLFLKDICIALPNILGFVLGLLQMLLYGLYRNSKRGTEEQNIKSIVILSTLGASEVYPLDAQPYNIANKDAKKEHEQTVVDVDLEKSMEPPVHELQAIECAV